MAAMRNRLARGDLLWDTGQHAMPRERSAAPATRAMTKPAGVSRGVPSNKEASSAGIRSKARPVAASRRAVRMSNGFMDRPKSEDRSQNVSLSHGLHKTLQRLMADGDEAAVRAVQVEGDKDHEGDENDKGKRS